MRISKARRASVGMLAAAALVLAGCGSDDEEGAADTPEAATAADDEAADDEAAEPTADDNADDNDDGEEQEINDLDDLPDECVDLMGDFLERIEPIVEDVDWDSASMEDFEGIAEELEAEASEMEDDEVAERCENFSFADDGGLAQLRELAEDRAPGVLGFLDWQEELMAGFEEELADISIPDISMPDISIPDISIPDITIPGVSFPEGTPATCEEAIAYVEEVMASADSMMDLPISELTQFSNAQLVISSDCSVNEMTDFFNRQDVQDFMSGV